MASLAHRLNPATYPQSQPWWIHEVLGKSPSTQDGFSQHVYGWARCSTADQSWRRINLHKPIASSYLLEFFAFVEAFLGRLVESGEVGDVGRVCEEVGVRHLHVVDEHSELSPPVADVVMSGNLEAKRRELRRSEVV